MPENSRDLSKKAKQLSPRVKLDDDGGELQVLKSDQSWGIVPGDGAGGGGTPADTVASLDGSGVSGAATEYSRGDHKHADPNRPGDGEKFALVGTSGAPGSGNKFVTDADSRNSNARTPVAHGHVKADISDFAHGHVKADISDFSHGHVKADISDFAHTHPASDIASGLIATARLGSGTPDGTKFLRDDQQWIVPSGGGGGGAWTTVKKTADESVANNTLQDDDHLFFTLIANTKYHVKLRVFFTTAATPDFKYRVVASGATITLVRRWTDRVVGGGTARTAVAVLTAFDAADVAMAGAGAEGILNEDIIILVGGTGGTFRFQWAQNTTNATPAIVRAGSYLEHMTI